VARRARTRYVPLMNRMHPTDEHEAAALIRGRRVVVDGRIIDNPNAWIPAQASVVIRAARPLRGTVKLRAALERSKVKPRAKACLDVGAAAGGFTFALIEAGARTVYAVDTGYGQLLGALRQDPRVVNLERVNLAHLDRSLIPEEIDLVTIDLSYVPLAAGLGQLHRVGLSPSADLLALVKPTFELRAGRPVREPAEIYEAVGLAVRAADDAGWRTIETFPSILPGAGGTPEVILHARRPHPVW